MNAVRGTMPLAESTGLMNVAASRHNRLRVKVDGETMLRTLNNLNTRTMHYVYEGLSGLALFLLMVGMVLYLG